MKKEVLFQTTRFSKRTQFTSLGPIDSVLSGATNLGQSGPGCEGNEGVLHIPQSSCITGASLSELWRERFTFIPERGFISHVWRRGRLALDPLYNKSSFRVFSQAYKTWHITWRTNLGPDWPPLARGSKSHTIHTPTKATKLLPLDNRRYGPISLVVIILYCSSRQLRFPVWYF